MKLNEYREIYHPSFGKFVFKHRGSGLIVDNIFKPMKKIVESVLKPVAKKALKSGIESAGDKLGKKVVESVLKPVAKKALKSGIESAGDKLGKKVVRKSGHLFIKDIQKEFKKSNPRKQEEDYNVLLNRMISGEGYKKKNKKVLNI